MIFYELKNQIEFNKIIDFKGSFDSHNASEISDKIEFHLQAINDKKRLNTVSYSGELMSIFSRNSVDIFRNECRFLMTFDEKEIKLLLGGVFTENNAYGFKTALEEINESIGDKEKLQELYREKLGNFSIDDRSGLGLLGIARRTGNPLLFNFEDFENRYELFELLVTIGI